MADYICKHCKFNNNGWCAALKKNKLKDTIECERFQLGKYGDFKGITNNKKLQIKIKYFSEDYPRLEKIFQGDLIDLRVDSIKHYISHKDTEIPEGAVEWDFDYDGEFQYKEGDVIKIGLGVAMELPEGYEAEIRPRSSTFRKYGLIQTNSVGTIDNSYKGDNDEWMVEFIAMRDGKINRFDRVCQFRIWENQPSFEFEEVDKLGNEDRGGYGSTGRD